MTTGAAIAGKYRLLRPLGKGSMGEVWAALHINLGREVALKLIYEGSPELAARLKREAQACGRLEHPNIVRVYDFGETDGGDPFLVMEMLAGETLADRLARRQRLPLGEAVSIALDVARALRAAHEAGVIHRDLKPANVFLCQRPEGETVKVLDFGVSKILSVDDMSVTTTGALVGSPAYMSPEQARALREIDPRADVWSAGVLLFEMLTGQRPFPSPTVVGVVADILAGPIPTLASVLPGVDPRVEQLDVGAGEPPGLAIAGGGLERRWAGHVHRVIGGQQSAQRFLPEQHGQTGALDQFFGHRQLLRGALFVEAAADAAFAARGGVVDLRARRVAGPLVHLHLPLPRHDREIRLRGGDADLPADVVHGHLRDGDLVGRLRAHRPLRGGEHRDVDRATER